MKGPAMWNSFRTDARTGITAEVITYPGGGGHQRHLLGRPSRPAGWETVFGFFSRDLSG